MDSLPVRAFVSLVRGEEVCGLPARRVWLAIDAFLVAAIIWAIFAPYDAGIGPSSGYREPDLHHMVRAQADASRAMGAISRPWSANGTAHPRKLSSQKERQQSRRERRQQKLKKQQRQQQQQQGGGGVDDAAAAAAATEAHNNATCAAAVREHSCPRSARRVVVTLSIGKRTHFASTGVAMEAYAKRVGAEFVVVNSAEHASLAGWNATLQAGSNKHFMKLPMLQW